IPDYLALVGDSADGYPGISGCGPKTAAQLINRYGPVEEFPPTALSDENRQLALLCKELAILKTDAPLFADVDELRWRGATPEFASVAEKIGSARLLTKVRKLERSLR
ncbi:MAG TPA: 5'-3' exonuclease H3TH domain-containing protein, partial [Pyrinomonadaceae bacterium]|nr:5'-3' exonuclease H3TH domain-containing protein [Pyrinomonadaceae bacterium]